MSFAPIGSSSASVDAWYRRRRLVPGATSISATFWIAAALWLVTCCESVAAAGRNRGLEHGQRFNSNNNYNGGETSGLVGGGNGSGVGNVGGGGFRSRQDRLRHHQPDKYALTIAKEDQQLHQQHSEFMKGKSE